MTSVVYKPGDWVIYKMQKRSRHPGPRARSVHPAEMGDDYGYVVDKFWIVVDSLSDGSVLLKTRRGKTHTVRSDDPLLRKAGWWERWRHKNRFPAQDLQSEAQQQQSSAAAGV